jgi:hypothetical protein
MAITGAKAINEMMSAAADQTRLPLSLRRAMRLRMRA